MTTWSIFGEAAILVITLFITHSYYEAYKRRKALKRWKEQQAGKADLGAGTSDGFS